MWKTWVTPDRQEKKHHRNKEHKKGWMKRRKGDGKTSVKASPYSFPNDLIREQSIPAAAA